jgi:hypothetical protein
MRFDPTRSRRQGEPVLQTYGEGNDRGRAGDDGAIQSVLRLRGALQLRLAPLKLLLGSIASDVNESSLCGGYLCALGFGAYGTKFDEYRLLFIGLLGPTRRGDGVLHFLSINRTLIRLRLEDFWKGMNFRFVMIWKPNSRPG